MSEQTGHGPQEFGESSNATELVSAFAVFDEFNEAFPHQEALGAAFAEAHGAVPNFIERMVQDGLAPADAVQAYLDINGGSVLDQRRFAMEMATFGYTDILEKAGLSPDTEPTTKLMPLIHDGERFVKYLQTLPNGNEALTAGLEATLAHFNGQYPYWMLLEKHSDIVARYGRMPFWIQKEETAQSASLVYGGHRPAINECAANATDIMEQMQRLGVDSESIEQFKIITTAEQEGFGAEYAYLKDLGVLDPTEEELTRQTYNHWYDPEQFAELDMLLKYIAEKAEPFSETPSLILPKIIQALELQMEWLSEEITDPEVRETYDLFAAKLQEYIGLLGNQ